MANNKTKNIFLSDKLNEELHETKFGLTATMMSAIALAATIFSWVEFNYLIETPRQLVVLMGLTMFIAFFGVVFMLMGTHHTVVRGKRAAHIYFNQMARCAPSARGRR